jgi:RNA polymerase sigma factor (sigma-70 family)
VARESGRLERFIRRRVADVADAEDILQDVLSEFVEASRLVRPIEQAGAWLFRVARNRIVDLFRRRRRHVSISEPVGVSDDQPVLFEDLLPGREGGPEAAYARQVLIGQIEAAIDELPAEQRFVFVAHELEGRSFKALANETGESVNTLLSRKHNAVRRLRRRLEAIHAMFQEGPR